MFKLFEILDCPIAVINNDSRLFSFLFQLGFKCPLSVIILLFPLNALHFSARKNTVHVINKFKGLSGIFLFCAQIGCSFLYQSK